MEYITRNDNKDVDDVLYNIDRLSEAFNKWIEYPDNDELWEQLQESYEIIAINISCLC